ncbi:MAG: CPBP family intramembrane glutamic endopeptidase [Luteolibacter sp.]
MNDPSQLALALIFLFTLVGAACAILFRSQFGQSGLRATPPPIPQGKVSAWFYRPGDLVGALVLYLVFAGLFALSCLAAPMDAEDYTAGALIFSMVFQLILAAVVCRLALRLTNSNQWLGWRWKAWPWLFLIGPGVVIFMLVIFWLIQLSGYLEWMESLGVETIQDTVSLLQEGRDPVVLILLVITATLIAPVCEEVVFRGYLHPILKKYGGVWVGALFSSLLFSVAHGNLAVALPLFLLGAILVWLYELTGSIWAPIAVHFCFNATTVFAQLATRNMEIPSAILPGLQVFP